MENASKALLIIGGILFTILMISLLVYGVRIVGDYYDAQAEEQAVKELTEFNLGYTNYERNDLLGYELLSLINKVIDYNQLESETFDEDSTVGNRALYSPIEIQVILWGGTKHNITEGTVQTKLTTQITCPAKIGDLSGISTDDTLKLFEDRRYIQNDTIHMFEGNILDEINRIEGMEDYGKKNGIKSLVKNINSIYQGNIVGYNEGIVQPSWYEADEIVKKFETLTGISFDAKFVGITDEERIKEIYEDIIDNDIRTESAIKDVQIYYEYTQFQKAIFDCVSVEYHPQTGRVSKMVFEFTGEVK